MPDPHETLSTFTEVAVALAGIAGIINAFKRRAPAA